jgi:hypothetical protein
MSKSAFVLAAIASASIYASAGAAPAQAEILYPFCTTETRWEGPHCDYRSFEECVAVNAGLNVTCVPNKWYGEATGGRYPMRQDPWPARRRAG